MTSLAHAAPRYARVLRSDELRDGELMPVEIDGWPVVLVRHAGEFFAVQNNCSHRTSRSRRPGSTRVTACSSAPGTAAVSTSAPARPSCRPRPSRSRSSRFASARRLGRDRPDREPGARTRRRERRCRSRHCPSSTGSSGRPCRRAPCSSVGLTEALGGTTRGYRLFMAWLLVAFAAILVPCELPRCRRGTLRHRRLRRALASRSPPAALAYLVASVAGWPRAAWPSAPASSAWPRSLRLPLPVARAASRSSPPSSSSPRSRSARSTPRCCWATGTWSRRSCRRRRCGG